MIREWSARSATARGALAQPRRENSGSRGTGPRARADVRYIATSAIRRLATDPPRLAMDGVAGRARAFAQHADRVDRAERQVFRATGIAPISSYLHETELGRATGWRDYRRFVPGPDYDSSERAHVAAGTLRFGRSLCSSSLSAWRKTATSSGRPTTGCVCPRIESEAGFVLPGTARDGGSKLRRLTRPSLPIEHSPDPNLPGWRGHASMAEPAARVRPLGRTGLSVARSGSVRAAGTGDVENPLGRRPDADSSHAIVQAALDLWVNFFDTAPGYCVGGGARSYSARHSQGGARTSSSAPSSGHTAEGWEPTGARARSSLRRAELRRVADDYLDIVLLHSPPPELLDESLASLRRAGPLQASGCPAGTARPSISGQPSTSW